MLIDVQRHLIERIREDRERRIQPTPHPGPLRPLTREEETEPPRGSDPGQATTPGDLAQPGGQFGRIGREDHGPVRKLGPPSGRRADPRQVPAGDIEQPRGLSPQRLPIVSGNNHRNNHRHRQRRELRRGRGGGGDTEASQGGGETETGRRGVGGRARGERGGETEAGRRGGRSRARGRGERGGGGRGEGRRGGGGRLLDDDVRVRATHAERRDTGPPRPIPSRPRPRRGEQRNLTGRPVHMRSRLVRVQRRGQRRVPHRQDHLDDPGHPRSGLRMPDIRLDRAQPQRLK